MGQNGELLFLIMGTRWRTQNCTFLGQNGAKPKDECVSCGTCAAECPVEAISEGDSKYEIDADTCVDCGTCAGVCPTEAIVEG